MGTASPHEIVEPLRERAAGGDQLWSRLAVAEDANAYCQAWLALQCAAIDHVGTALLLLNDGAGSFVPAAVWPDARADVSYLGAIARRCLGERKPHSERAGEGAPARLHAAYPLEEGGELLGAVVLDLQGRADSELRKVWRALHWGSGRVEVMLLRRLLDTRHEAHERARLALEVSVSVSEHPQLDAALMQLGNELATRLAFERVAVGLEKRGRIRLRALSGAAWFESKTEFAIALENAMEEACDQARTVCWPVPEDGGGVISVAHRDLAGQGAAFSVVLNLRGRAIGAITCLGAAPAERAMVAAVEAIAALLAPQLEVREELNRWFAGRLVQKLGSFWRACRDPRRPSFRVGASLVLALLLFLGFASGEYRVSGKALIEGEVQRAIVAPFDGFILKANVRAGQRVASGDLLAALDDRDLRLDYGKWLAQGEQAERKYRDALARHDRANARILAAQLAEANAEASLVEDKLARASIVAPFAGVVVSGDLSQMLGTPIEKGKVLFEVAPLDAYRVILKVPEHAIREVRAGQTGQIVLAGMAGEKMAFTVRNIGVATAEEGENLFRVEAELAAANRGLRPGMEGVGKIAIGERRLVWIWTHTFFDWLGLKLWHWLP